MNLFEDQNASLEDVLSRKSENDANTISQQFAKKRKQAVSQQAASGRLGSGVANYTLGDIDSAEIGDLGGVYGGLADALGKVPTTDYTTEQDFQRKMQLAKAIGNANKPSVLEQALGGLGTAGDLAATYAAFAGG